MALRASQQAGILPLHSEIHSIKWLSIWRAAPSSVRSAACNMTQAPPYRSRAPKSTPWAMAGVANRRRQTVADERIKNLGQWSGLDFSPFAIQKPPMRHSRGFVGSRFSVSRPGRWSLQWLLEDTVPDPGAIIIVRNDARLTHLGHDGRSIAAAWSSCLRSKSWPARLFGARAGPGRWHLTSRISPFVDSLDFWLPSLELRMLGNVDLFGGPI